MHVSECLIIWLLLSCRTTWSFKQPYWQTPWMGQPTQGDERELQVLHRIIGLDQLVMQEGQALELPRRSKWSGRAIVRSLRIQSCPEIGNRQKQHEGRSSGISRKHYNFDKFCADILYNPAYRIKLRNACSLFGTVPPNSSVFDHFSCFFH